MTFLLIVSFDIRGYVEISVFEISKVDCICMLHDFNVNFVATQPLCDRLGVSVIENVLFCINAYVLPVFQVVCAL